MITIPYHCSRQTCSSFLHRGGMIPRAQTSSIAFIERAYAQFNPSWSNIWQAVQKGANGLAIPFRVMSKAAPWIGSNIEELRRSGSIFTFGATPILPVKAPARSERTSVWRLVATIVFKLSGYSVLRTVIASTNNSPFHGALHLICSQRSKSCGIAIAQYQMQTT